VSYTFTLPWEAVARDSGGARYIIARRPTGPRLILSPGYRAAKQYAHTLGLKARNAAGLRAPLTGPLAWTARVWFPDRRRRDAGNLRKMLTDAMSGVWYEDDSQLYRETWERAGIAKGGRIEIEIAAL
jgi:Holliday junction resolvase RusA-like endonuclease